MQCKAYNLCDSIRTRYAKKGEGMSECFVLTLFKWISGNKLHHISSKNIKQVLKNANVTVFSVQCVKSHTNQRKQSVVQQNEAAV